jgi:hypothetical protein
MYALLRSLGLGSTARRFGALEIETKAYLFEPQALREPNVACSLCRTSRTTAVRANQLTKSAVVHGDFLPFIDLGIRHIPSAFFGQCSPMHPLTLRATTRTMIMP